MNKQIVMLREGFRVLNTLSPKTSAKLAEKLFLFIPKPKLSPEDRAFLNTARKYSVPFKGSKLMSYEWGDPGAPAVMVVHGWNSSAAAFIDLVPKLLASGYRVISYDMASHGLSPKLNFQITCWADAVRSVLAYHGKVDTIIGHSLGGTGILIASKLGLPIKKIVFISTSSDVVDISNRFAQMLNIPNHILEMKQQNIWEKFGDTTQQYGNNWHEIVNSTFKVPTLIYHDHQDEDIAPENSIRIKQNWSWAKLEFTQNLGHQRILHDENTLNNIVSFVSEINNSFDGFAYDCPVDGFGSVAAT